MGKTYIRVKRSAESRRYWKGIRNAKARLRRKNRRFRSSQFDVRRREEAFARASVHRSNPTPAEKEMRRLLIEEGVTHIFQYVMFLSFVSYRIADFYLPEYRVAVELDGSAHDIPEIRAYDDKKDRLTKIQVLRFRNEDVFKPDFLKNLLAPLKKQEKIEPHAQVKKWQPKPIQRPIHKPHVFTAANHEKHVFGLFDLKRMGVL